MRFLPFLLTILATPALAAPRVATDIAPVHSLVAQVMAGVGTPDLILPIGASPHGYAMRPSEAAALQDADIVFWIGDALTPWLGRNIKTLAADAKSVELLGAGASHLSPNRTAAVFEHHDDDHAEDDHAKHDDHDAHDDHAAHDDHEGEEDHAAHDGEEGHEDHDGEEGHDHHDHGEFDPHAWLDPDNAVAWLDVIAETLAAADPEHAAAYTANADAAKTRIETLSSDVEARLAPVQSARFVVFHDAYQYFETRFDVASVGAISLGDAQKPGPARITELQDFVAHENIVCVFSEPQYNAGVIDAVFGGAGVATGVLDPLGASLEQGPGFYAALMTNMADAMATCLSGPS